MKNGLKIVCKNQVGEEITFAYDFPYWLTDLQGFSKMDVKVNTEAFASGDGASYRGAQMEARTLEITANCIGTPAQHAAYRDQLFSFFAPRQTGTLYYIDGEVSRKIDYKVETVQVASTGQVREVYIALVCPDPLWKATLDDGAYMAIVEGDIEFTMELEDEWTVSHTNNTVMASIFNGSNVSRGVTITFEATGYVVNPKLIEVGRQQWLQINTTMNAGDKIVITTSQHNKHVKLISGGVTTEINNKWVPGSTWLQVEPGSNVFRYTADSGESSLSTRVSSTPLYWGV